MKTLGLINLFLSIKHVTPIRPSVTVTCQKITANSFEAYFKQFFMDTDFQVNYFDLYRIFFVGEYEFTSRLSGRNNKFQNVTNGKARTSALILIYHSIINMSHLF